MTDTNPRDLIKRLAEKLDHYRRPLMSGGRETHALIAEARAYLAQPEPEGLTDEEIEREALTNADSDDEYRAFKSGAFFVQERISRPAIEPVPVSERLPKPEDCDAEGKCWWGRPSEELCNSDWFLATRAEVDEFCDASPPIVFLPHWALPVPTKAS